MPKVIPVILCGEAGSRLWPLSRTDTPKQFLKLLDNHTLLQKTALRAMNITGAQESDLIIIASGRLKPEAIRQMEELSPEFRHILGEPQARDTAAAVAYAANYAQRHFGDEALLWILPSDHYIGDEGNLGEALGRAVEIAQQGYLVTFGIEPTRADTGYGYIRKAEQLPGPDAFRASTFVEKPPLGVAFELFRSGQYLWSSGMHIFKVRTVMENYARHAPITLAMVQRAFLESANDQKLDMICYSLINQESFESAVMEKSEKIAVVPCDPQWSDIGSWESLWEIKPKNENGNALKGRVVCEKTENSMILAQNRLVTCVGLKDIVVIETADTVLVADKRSSGALKMLVQALQKNGHREIMSSSIPHAGAAPAPKIISGPERPGAAAPEFISGRGAPGAAIHPAAIPVSVMPTASAIQ